MEYVELHSHTDHSDGCNSIWEMANEAKEKGITTLCITDHLGYRMPGESYFRCQAELYTLEKMGKKLPVNVIIGAEVATSIGDVLFFGEDVIHNWILEMHRFRGMYKELGFNAYWEAVLHCIIDKHVEEYAAIWAHPNLIPARRASTIGANIIPKIIHGFEIMNRGHATDKDTVTALIELGLKPFRGGDAHHKDNLGTENISTANIAPKNEQELIKWIRGYALVME